MNRNIFRTNPIRFLSASTMLLVVCLLPLSAQEKVITVNPQGQKVVRMNERRKGFILSVSPLLHAGSLQVVESQEHMIRGFLGADLKFGYGFTDQSLLYLGILNTWLPLNLDPDAADESSNGTTRIAWFRHQIGGFGYQYYFKPEAPSIFVSFLAGPSIRLVKEKKSELAFGIAGSIGYEWRKSWSVSLGMTWGKASYPTIQWFQAGAEPLSRTIKMPAGYFLSVNYLVQ
jgi:hypothetical protein